MIARKNSFFYGALIGLVILGTTVLTSVNVFAVDAQIGGQVNGYSCEGADSNRWKIETGNVATLPNGYSFGKVVVKAGQNCVQVYPINTAPTCYQLVISCTTATVTKIGSGSSCKDISNLEGTYIVTQSPSPSASPSISPSPSPSPSPSLSPSPSPSPSPSSSVSPSPSPSPSPSASSTPTPTPSSTPSPSSDNNSSSSNNSVSSSTSSSEPQGEVLGAYASTGVAEDVIMNALGSLGGLMTVAGSVLYGKKRK